MESTHNASKTLELLYAFYTATSIQLEDFRKNHKKLIRKLQPMRHEVIEKTMNGDCKKLVLCYMQQAEISQPLQNATLLAYICYENELKCAVEEAVIGLEALLEKSDDEINIREIMADMLPAEVLIYSMEQMQAIFNQPHMLLDYVESFATERA